MDTAPQTMYIRDAAAHLDVSVDMLRNWERNGLITIPRDPDNHYRLYGSTEFGRLRVIRMLVQCGFSLMAILRMLNQFDQGATDNLRDALNLPPEESINENIEVIADHWLESLIELEKRAQAIIDQIGLIITLHQPYTSTPPS
jgi:DNA-binding transcriptional MerR regulator